MLSNFKIRNKLIIIYVIIINYLKYKITFLFNLKSLKKIYKKKYKI